jgi:O-antigen/teichoic acid export membrane protein
LKQIIKQFLNKDGAHVIGASFLTKAVAFISSLVLVRILSPSEYGVLAYVLSTLAFFIPFSGGGLQHSFMRFAPLKGSSTKAGALFLITLGKGLLISGVISIILFLSIPFLNLGTINPSYFYLLLMYLFTYFFMEMVKVLYRVQNNNKKFASIEALSATLLAIFGCLFAYYFGGIAYVAALVFVPFFVGIYNLQKLKKVKVSIPEHYYSYGLWVGIGSIASQLMYSLDVFLVGQLIQDTTQVAIYRSASIIPIALFFIPNSYITTHYADLARNSKNKHYLVEFSKEYIKLFSLVAGGISLPLYLFAEPLILVLFGQDYIEAVPLFRVLIIGMLGAFIFRIPFGNLLAAVGKSNWNAYVAFAILFLNAILNYVAISTIGIMGAAIVTSMLFWISGIISLVLFYKYLKKLN